MVFCNKIGKDCLIASYCNVEDYCQILETQFFADWQEFSLIFFRSNPNQVSNFFFFTLQLIIHQSISLLPPISKLRDPIKKFK